MPPDKSGDVIVIVMGASEFPHASLSAHKSFANSAHAFRDHLKRVLVRPIDDGCILDLFDDPREVVGQTSAIIEFLASHRGATDLMIYYVGHGSFLADRTYFLALRCTRTGAEPFTTIRIRDIATLLKEHYSSGRLYLILDCCYAGSAVEEFQGSGVGSVIEKRFFDSFPGNGSALLVASSKDDEALAPSDRDLTMFSESLIDVMAHGVSGSPAQLSLVEIGDAVRNRIERRDAQRAVLPQVHSPRQNGIEISRLPLFRNVAYVEPPPPELSREITDALKSGFTSARNGAVDELARLIAGPDGRLVELAARELEVIASGDDSVAIRARAAAALGRRPARADPADADARAQSASDRRAAPRASPSTSASSVVDVDAPGPASARPWTWESKIKIAVGTVFACGIGGLIVHSMWFGRRIDMEAKDLDWEPRFPKVGQLVTFTGRYSASLRQRQGLHWSPVEISGEEMADVFTGTWSVDGVSKDVVDPRKIRTGEFVDSKFETTFEKPGNYAISFSIKSKQLDDDPSNDKMMRTITVASSY